MWLDIQGSPVTESARVTERLTRVNLGLMNAHRGTLFDPSCVDALIAQRARILEILDARLEPPAAES